MQVAAFWQPDTTEMSGQMSLPLGNRCGSWYNYNAFMYNKIIYLVHAFNLKFHSSMHKEEVLYDALIIVSGNFSYFFKFEFILSSVIWKWPNKKQHITTVLVHTWQLCHVSFARICRECFLRISTT